ncbi:disulfide bond formation protein DsbA [Sphingorhabdus lutea]|uniref:2-hydroxychromene-2-carboxylate isomerase n=1 Tax=Sphingorhabdus lutea TaxID=1913578 RepID=A0A1L3JCB8_9SPHN|nr:DsbA family protein [Sphingorhabdus lutea]APG62774.1 disulfide bond formation protein DsbA [Sphingorhabdus lutea]
MTLSADIFWSFRSPYSFLAMPKYRAMLHEYDVILNLRPVYPLAIRQPDFFERNHPNWLSYTVRDVMRVAQKNGINMAMPNPDPIKQNMMTREISPDQPHIYRLTRLGQVAARQGRSFAFADEVSQLIWGGVINWHEGEYLAEAAMRAGLNFAEMEQIALNDAPQLDKEIADNQKALERGGHWGVPTLIFDEEPFFGQDRIELAIWRMKEKGLKAR